jgi:hypothetical protein
LDLGSKSGSKSKLESESKSNSVSKSESESKSESGSEPKSDSQSKKYSREIMRQHGVIEAVERALAAHKYNDEYQSQAHRLLVHLKKE